MLPKLLALWTIMQRIHFKMALLAYKTRYMYSMLPNLHIWTIIQLAN